MKDGIVALLTMMAVVLFTLIVGGALTWFAYNTIVGILFVHIASLDFIPLKISFIDGISLYVAFDIIKNYLLPSSRSDKNPISTLLNDEAK